MIARLSMVALMLACCVQPAAPVVPDDVCVQAYNRLVALKCGMQRTAKGALFVDVCRHYAAQFVDIGAQCIIASTSCHEAELCK